MTRARPAPSRARDRTADDPASAPLPLRSIELVRPAEGADRFPFSVPTIRALERLDLAAPVTFLVGENGSGKSTLLEGLAAAVGSITVGAAPVERDETLRDQARLGKYLRLVWNRRSRKGFFLRAEDFFGFARRISQLRAEMQARLAEVAQEFADASEHARGLAAGPAATSIAELERRYGVSLDARSHGESFLKLFQARLVPGGLYLLDEPEAPLSPQNQLALIALLRQAVADGSQFIIATHSPILMALPGAIIISFDAAPPVPVQYQELDHVLLTRDFLNDPERFLRRLWGEGEGEMGWASVPA